LFDTRAELLSSLGNFFGFDDILCLVSFTFSLSFSFSFAGGRNGYNKDDYQFDYM
jgi:hypothetical protein